MTAVVSMDEYREQQLHRREADVAALADDIMALAMDSYGHLCVNDAISAALYFVHRNCERLYRDYPWDAGNTPAVMDNAFKQIKALEAEYGIKAGAA